MGCLLSRLLISGRCDGMGTPRGTGWVILVLFLYSKGYCLVVGCCGQDRARHDGGGSAEQIIWNCEWIRMGTRLSMKKRIIINWFLDIVDN